MSANQRAWELRRKLWELIDEYRALQMSINKSGFTDDISEAHSQVDQAACALASVHSQLGDVFVDVAQDKQSYGFDLK